jgi:hypothetical protein
MKYVLPLMLVTSALWGAAHEPLRDRIGSPSAEERAGSVSRRPDPPWVTSATDEVDIQVEDSDPHAGLSYDDDTADDGEDPHAGLFLQEHSSSGMCPRDDSDDGEEALGSDEPDPHLQARAPASGVELPKGGVTRSAASNGRSISELHAQRGALSEQLVRVRGTVVKRTDGILGKTYLHLRDGTGSAEREDDDLTVTTTEEFALGETVEVEGRLEIDQDLGLGYRYAALLTGAIRAPSH